MFSLLKVEESCKESSNDISKRAVIILVNLVELLFTKTYNLAPSCFFQSVRSVPLGIRNWIYSTLLRIFLSKLSVYCLASSRNRFMSAGPSGTSLLTTCEGKQIISRDAHKNESAYAADLSANRVGAFVGSADHHLVDYDLLGAQNYPVTAYFVHACALYIITSNNVKIFANCARLLTLKSELSSQNILSSGLRVLYL